MSSWRWRRRERYAVVVREDIGDIEMPDKDQMTDEYKDQGMSHDQ